MELIHLFVFDFTFQEENLWQKEREEELHRTMTQLNLLDRHKNAFTKKNMFISQEHMVRFGPLVLPCTMNRRTLACKESILKHKLRYEVGVKFTILLNWILRGHHI